MSIHQNFLLQAVKLAQENKTKGGRPFGALIVKDQEIIASGVNEMIKKCDPSSHAELEAIRMATKKLGRLTLEGCSVYASGQPCPMCLAALVMIKIEAVYFAFDNSDSAPFGFSSELTYQKLDLHLEEIDLPVYKIDLGLKASELYQI